jgi:hypothetical protein
MNSQTQRRLEPAIVEVEREVVAPLSRPSYGPYSKARRKWRKPLAAVVADVMINSQALLARLERGMYAFPPNIENKPHYQEVYNQLCWRTQEQLKALEAFSQVEWRE